MPRRRIPAEELCVERIQVQVGIGYDYVRCSNRGKYVEAGRLVCGTHSQAAEDRREEKRQKREDAYLANIRERSRAEAKRDRKINCFPNLLEALTVANDTLQGLDAYLASSALDDWHWRNLSAAIDGAKAALKEATKEPEVK